LYDLLFNYGATGIRGGLNLLLKVIGLPGKGALDGSRVQDYYEAGRLDEIRRYCRRDVIQTYFLFLRVELMRGRLDQAGYRAASAASAPFMAELLETAPAAAEH
jgi:predicted PolB exonuclease-like 3'-5' exonuclease